MTDISVTTEHKYTMRISRLTVDKLGVKLYDRVSAVLAELVANSYDADATRVEIIAPLGEYLAARTGGQVVDGGHQIIVRDDGHGMTPQQVQDFYLEVGAERRQDTRRGDTSPRFGRKVMGRKGVGKLAPFGICEKIEVITAGGDPVEGVDADGTPAVGYRTAHIILDRTKILADTTEQYPPVVGSLDESIRAKRGTTLILSGFGYRMVPALDDLSRQLAQRFGIQGPDWKIVLVDSLKSPGDANYSGEVGSFDIAKLPGTQLTFDGTSVFDAEREARDDISSGFLHEGRFYPVTGWIGYAKEPYRDDLMAGVRIYCRGKIAAQTSIFNRKAGFTGEHDVRSYLVGELNADWLDEEEDLIQTDRRDILWSHEIGQIFERWGQGVVVKIGRASRQPMRQSAWERFLELSGLNEKVRDAFPASAQQAIRDNALEIAKSMAQTMRGEELDDDDIRRSVVNLSLLFAPHLTLDRKLREASEQDSTLEVLTGILRTARVAELSSFGRIAENRVSVIETVEQKVNETHTEDIYQELIADAPWLIDPQWAPITANQSFATLKLRFQVFFKEQTGDEIELGDFFEPNKRADFVLSNHDDTIELMEIKRPGHRFEDEELVRLNRYADIMEAFLADPSNAEFKQRFQRFHITLVCDSERLTGVYKRAFEGLIADGKLTWISWSTFLLRTRNMHQEFLAEAQRQRTDAAQAYV